MTNYEAFREKLIDFLANDITLSVRNGVPVNCAHYVNCEGCLFALEKPCSDARIKWMNAEYVEQPKLTQREWHLCKALETGWIARDKDNRLFAYIIKPKKGVAMWIDGNDVVTICGFMPNSFEFIQWKDHEPWSIEELLKLEVEG